MKKMEQSKKYKNIFFNFLCLIFAIIGIYYFGAIAIICSIICCICNIILREDNIKKLNENVRNYKKLKLLFNIIVNIISFGILPISILYSIGFNNLIDNIIYCFFILAELINLVYCNLHFEINSYSFDFFTISNIILNVTVIFVYFLFKNEFIWLTVLLILTILLMFSLKLKKINKQILNKTGLKLISLVSLIFIITLLVQLFYNASNYGHFVWICSAKSLIFSFLFILLIFLILLAITKKSYRAIVILSIVMLILSFVNALKIYYTDTPIYFEDILFLNNITNLYNIIEGTITNSIQSFAIYFIEYIIINMIIWIIAFETSITISNRKIRGVPINIT